MLYRPSLMIYTLCQPGEVAHKDEDGFLPPTKACLNEDVYYSIYLSSFPPKFAFSVYGRCLQNNQISLPSTQARSSAMCLSSRKLDDA